MRRGRRGARGRRRPRRRRAPGGRGGGRRGGRAARAATWLAANSAGAPAGQQADAVVALRAAGRRRASLRPRVAALAKVAPAYATTAGGAGKVVMAAVAARRDPASLGGVNYLRRITGRYAAGRYGATAWDQALSLLALRAAGRTPPAAAVRATLAGRGTGGWSFDLQPDSRDSVNATAIVLEALAASGVKGTDARVAAAVRWMLAQRNGAGGLASAGGGAPSRRQLDGGGHPGPAGDRPHARRRRCGRRCGRCRTGTARCASPAPAPAAACSPPTTRWSRSPGSRFPCGDSAEAGG